MSRRTGLPRFGGRWWLAVVLLGVPAVSPHAQGQPAQPEQAFERITLTAGRSRVLTTDYDVTRLAITDPAIADAAVVAPREVLIDAKSAGVVSLILWGSDRRVQYDVAVEPGLTALEQQLLAIFPGETIQVSVSDESIVLTGQVSSSEVMLRAGEIARASSAKMRVVNLLQRPGSPGPQQVLLEVRFAEVGYNALTELGLNLLAARPNVDARITTGQFAAPFIDRSQPTPIQVPGMLNIFFALNREGLLATLRALQQRGELQSLAEPNLIAYDGEEASFLAGGEIPIPIVQGNTGQVTIEYREFGVRLTFRPTIAGETIRLRVRPEVSSLDYSNGLQLSGFTIPALLVRRAETDVELKDGQSFAIAGLLSNTAQDARSQIPLLGSVPIIGNLFKSKSKSATRTELLVLITPHLVRPFEPSEVPPLPIDPTPFITPPERIGAVPGSGAPGASAARPADEQVQR